NDKKIHELELLRQSQSDPLTKLYNRTAFGQIVNEYLNKKRESSSALLLIDIDNFKNINDNLGHSFGDTVLCEIAHKLTNIFN
ncbi:GGDEF domain-containing protein, partial [[Ruminococcus] gnavus]